MQHPDNLKYRDFDLFKRFHSLSGSYEHVSSFAYFETGETVALYRAAKKEARRMYKDLNVRISDTGDDVFVTRHKFKTPEGETILPSWIAHKTQPILIDYDTGVVVRLGRMLPSTVPTDLRTHRAVHAYIPGKGQRPYGGHLTLMKPTTNTELKQALKDRVATIDAWAQAAITHAGTDMYQAWDAAAPFMWQSHDMQALREPRRLLSLSFEQMTARQRFYIHRAGVRPLRDTVILDHMVLA